MSGSWRIRLVTAEAPDTGHRLHPEYPGGHPESDDGYEVHESKRLAQPAQARRNCYDKQDARERKPWYWRTRCGRHDVTPVSCLMNRA